MGKTTTIRISIESKNRLKRLAERLGVSLKDAVDIAIKIAEEKLDKFEGDLSILRENAKFIGESGYIDTSIRVDEVLGEYLDREVRGEDK